MPRFDMLGDRSTSRLSAQKLAPAMSMAMASGGCGTTAGEAGAGAGQQIQPVPVRRRIGFDRDQAGDAHPRIGERHSRCQPQCLRSRIHCRQPQRTFLLGDKSQPRVRRRAGLPLWPLGDPVRLLLPQAIRGEVRKPDRQMPLR
jgi:hypothetical protein